MGGDQREAWTTGGSKVDVGIVEQGDLAEHLHDRGLGDRRHGDHRPGDDRAHRPLQRPAERPARFVDVLTTVPASSVAIEPGFGSTFGATAGPGDLAWALDDRRRPRSGATRGRDARLAAVRAEHRRTGRSEEPCGDRGRTIEVRRGRIVVRTISTSPSPIIASPSGDPGAVEG